MCLYTADGYTGELIPCDEGKLEWVSKERLWELNLWEGDRLFLKMLLEDAPFFSMKLYYEGDKLCEAVVDGRKVV